MAGLPTLTENIQVGLELHDHTDSIMLTSAFAYGETTEGKRVSICGSGKIVRINIEGIDGYVDIDISGIVNRSVRLLEEKQP